MVDPLELTIEERPIRVPTGVVTLEGDLGLPEKARGIVLFAHGSGSSRLSSRNRYVARLLNEAKLATVLVDLLTAEKRRSTSKPHTCASTSVCWLSGSSAATDWIMQYPDTQHLPIGYFGASTGAAAALVAAAKRPNVVRAVVSRGGRPDLAGAALPTSERRRSSLSAGTTLRSYS